MTKPHLEEELSALLTGELSAPERKRAESHLEECDFCRAQLARLQELDSLLRLDPPIEPTPGFASRVIQTANRESNVRAFPFRRIAAWAAMAAAVVLAVFLLRARTSLPESGPMAGRPAVREPAVRTPENAIPATTQETPEIAALSQEDTELIAHLDELENMEMIADLESLQNLDTALLATQTEHLQ